MYSFLRNKKIELGYIHEYQYIGVSLYVRFSNSGLTYQWGPRHPTPIQVLHLIQNAGVADNLGITKYHMSNLF